MIVLGSTNIVEQLSFFMFLSIMTFEFDFILGSFFTFGALMGYFWGWSRVKKMFWGSTHIVEQLLFSFIPSILILDFDYFWGSFFSLFWGLNGLICGWSVVPKLLFNPDPINNPIGPKIEKV